MVTRLSKTFLRAGLLLIPALLAPVLADAQSAEKYLPLREGNRWVLRNPSVQKPVTFEVLSRDGEGYRVRFDSPFGSNDWTLVPRGDQLILSQFGKDGRLMDLPANEIYFDFGAPAGHSWKMSAGQMKVEDKNASIQSAGQQYSSAIRISQGKNLVFTFAPNVGFVQFGEGKSAFVLDEAASRLASGASAPPLVSTARPVDDSRPVQHVPGAAPEIKSTSRARVRAKGVPRTAGPLLVGITVNTFANEALSSANLIHRWQQSIETGVNFVVSNGKWNEVETKKGSYQLDGLKFQVSEAEKNNLKVAYTLRLIDTVKRTMPSDLERKRWTDPEVRSRVIRLVEAMAPLFKDRVKWFMFGNEIDGYFGRHPDEVQDFAQLYDEVSQRIKELVPGIQVSSTMMFGGIETLQGVMSPLNDRFDFLAFTYYPIRADFTMKDPGIVANDFGLMRDAAAGRGVLLQEIGYASSPVNGSSQENQAAFVRNVFEQLKVNRDVFEGGSFFMLADFSDRFVKDLSGFYGITNSKTFSSFLQTTGLFDMQGNPKQAWSVFQSEVQSLKN